MLGTGSEVRFSRNYSQYRLAAADEKRKYKRRGNRTKPPTNQALSGCPKTTIQSAVVQGKFEFEQLEGKMSELEQQKASLTEQLYANPDPADLQVIGEKLHEVNGSKERKTVGLNYPSAQSAPHCWSKPLRTPGALELGWQVKTKPASTSSGSSA